MRRIDFLAIRLYLYVEICALYLLKLLPDTWLKKMPLRNRYKLDEQIMGTHYLLNGDVSKLPPEAATLYLFCGRLFLIMFGLTFAMKLGDLLVKVTR